MEQFMANLERVAAQLEILNRKLDRMDAGVSTSWQTHSRQSSCESWGEEYCCNYYPSMYHEDQSGCVHYDSNQPYQGNSFSYSYNPGWDEHFNYPWSNEQNVMYPKGPSTSWDTYQPQFHQESFQPRQEFQYQEPSHPKSCALQSNMEPSPRGKFEEQCEEVIMRSDGEEEEVSNEEEEAMNCDEKHQKEMEVEPSFYLSPPLLQNIEIEKGELTVCIEEEQEAFEVCSPMDGVGMEKEEFCAKQVIDEGLGTLIAELLEIRKWKSKRKSKRHRVLKVRKTRQWNDEPRPISPLHYSFSGGITIPPEDSLRNALKGKRNVKP